MTTYIFKYQTHELFKHFQIIKRQQNIFFIVHVPRNTFGERVPAAKVTFICLYRES